MDSAEGAAGGSADHSGAAVEAQSGPSRSRRVADSWWVASELIRRHPDLQLFHTHPGGGQYDCLEVHRPAEGGLVCGLNRHGSLHAAGNASGDESPRAWTQVAAEDDAHATVRWLEAAAGLTAPARTPPSTPAVLVYRAAAQMMAALVHARGQWDLCNNMRDSSLTSEPDAYLPLDPDLRIAEPFRATGGPTAPRPDWVLLRDGRPVALLRTDGLVRAAGAQHDLVALYRASGRSLTCVLATALGTVLP